MKYLIAAILTVAVLIHHAAVIAWVCVPYMAVVVWEMITGAWNTLKELYREQLKSIGGR